MKVHYLFILSCAMQISWAQAEIYKYTDPDGHVTYSSTPIKGAKKLDLESMSTPQPPTHSRSSENEASQSSFPIRFVYEMPSPQAGEKLGIWGSFAVEPPTLVNVDVIMEAHHQLWLPEGYHYTGFAGPMTLSAKDRGWQVVRNIADFLIPAFGPQLQQPVADWKPVPGIPQQYKATLGFQVSEQGRDVRLHRLGSPGTPVPRRFLVGCLNRSDAAAPGLPYQSRP